MNNYLINKFYKELIEVINHSSLPVGTAYFVLKDVLNEIQSLYNKAIIIDEKEQNIIKEQEIKVTEIEECSPQEIDLNQLTCEE